MGTLSEKELRLEIVSAGRRLVSLGLTRGTSGNVSGRTTEGMLITPSAVPCDSMDLDDLVLLDLAGGSAGASGVGGAAGASGGRPSIEWRMHAQILRKRPDVRAIVHAHPPWATALSCLRRDIPPFHYMVAIAGGPVIRCADYATFGTQELGDAAVAALGERDACLLANHGIVACGDSVGAALGLAVEVEALAGQYMRALSVGKPVLLGTSEMEAVLERFADYGGHQSTRLYRLLPVR